MRNSPQEQGSISKLSAQISSRALLCERLSSQWNTVWSKSETAPLSVWLCNNMKGSPLCSWKSREFGDGLCSVSRTSKAVPLVIDPLDQFPTGHSTLSSHKRYEFMQSYQVTTGQIYERASGEESCPQVGLCIMLNVSKTSLRTTMLKSPALCTAVATNTDL